MESFNVDGFSEFSLGNGIENKKDTDRDAKSETVVNVEVFESVNQWTVKNEQGSPFSDIKIERKPFAEGGMGFVFRAKEVDGTIVAAKMAISSEGAEELRRESYFLGNLEHKNIPKVIGFVEGQKTFDNFDSTKDGDESLLLKRVDTLTKQDVGIMFMEMVDGKSISDLLWEDQNRDKIFDRASEIVGGVGDAVDYLASKGIFHRDISDKNVLMSDETVKLIDFGVAWPLVRANEDGKLPGGDGSYCPPEILEVDKVGIAGETFSLAVLAYRVLSGGESPYGHKLVKGKYDEEVYAPMPRLWEDKGLGETPYESLNEKEFAVSKFTPQQITDLDMVFKKALAMDPNDRYQSGKELSNAILEIVNKK